jgi:hypothetical protein
MATVINDEIRGYCIGGEDVCLDCTTNAERDTAALDEIIVDADIQNDETIVYCDRCKQRL